MAKTMLSRGVWSVVGLLGVCLAIGCSNPHQQTIELPDSSHHDDFESAMKKLPFEEKNLVNEYVARRTSEGVRPVGVTIEEAIREQRRYEADANSLPDKLINGAVRVAQALNSKPAPTTVIVQPQGAPGAPVAIAPTADPGALPSVVPVVPVPAAPVLPTGVASAADMTALLQQIDALSFPSQKVSLLKDRAPSLVLTTRQAVTLARTVSFPSMQVEILSALYPRVVDRQNFDEVYSLFTFDSDREALRSRVAAMTGR